MAASRRRPRRGRAGRRQCAGRRLRRVFKGGNAKTYAPNIAAIRKAPRAIRRAARPLMIPRYSRPEMAAIWSPETRFRIWFEIEAHATDAMAELGVVPEGGREDSLGKGQQGDIRRRAHRRDRARGQARRHRLPDASRRDRRTRSALRASGHDLVRRARHLLRGAARRAPPTPDRRCRRAARGAEAPRLRAQDTRPPSAAATASMPSRPPSASSSPTPMPSSPAPRRG